MIEVKSYHMIQIKIRFFNRLFCTETLRSVCFAGLIIIGSFYLRHIQRKCKQANGLNYC